MKSNSTVYPYSPFRFLKRAKPTSTFLPPKAISPTQIKRILICRHLPKVAFHGRSIEEKILSIFLDPQVRFGPRKYVLDYKDEWLQQLSHFVKQGKPIKFTLLGFPFKIPVSLKTNRTLPDLGELLALQQLSFLMCLVKKVYKLGGVVYVFTEGPFASFADVSKKEAKAYYNRLVTLNRQFGFNHEIKLIDLGSLEKFVPNTKLELRERYKKLSSLYKAKNADFMTKYKSAFPSVFRIVNTRKLSIHELRQIYSDGQTKISGQAKRLKDALIVRANKAILHYFAYLKMRDDFRLVERSQPGALKLTVSPKPHRLGILPIDSKIKILYTHGVPVYKADKKTFDIQYLFDLERAGKTYQPVYLNGDKEDKPFYYSESGKQSDKLGRNN